MFKDYNVNVTVKTILKNNRIFGRIYTAISTNINENYYSRIFRIQSPVLFFILSHFHVQYTIVFSPFLHWFIYVFFSYFTSLFYILFPYIFSCSFYFLLSFLFFSLFGILSFYFYAPNKSLRTIFCSTNSYVYYF